MPKSRAERAQIFQSFDALKGFREILKSKEQIVVDKKLLSGDELSELDYKIHQIRKGMMVKVVHYENGQYIETEGIVSKINLDTCFLQIVKKKISIRTIVKIECDDIEDVLFE